MFEEEGNEKSEMCFTKRNFGSMLEMDQKREKENQAER